MSRGISFEPTFGKIGHAVCRRELPRRKVAQVQMTLASTSKQAQIYLLASYGKGASVMLSQLHISNVGG
jgi:hypothetical protein